MDALTSQVRPQASEILNDTVVHQVNVTITGNMGVRVDMIDAPVGRPSGVCNPHRPGTFAG